MKKAFTLAEVLITLGIIGVVAALTIPSLIQGNKIKETETRLKKFYSISNEAIKLSEVENGTHKNWDPIPADSENVLLWYNKYLNKYIKSSKVEKVPPKAIGIYFLDGSALLFSDEGWDFYPNANKVKNTSYKYGIEAFPFQYNEKGLEPYTKYWNGTDEQLISTCAKNGIYCTKLIQNNGWSIPEDYPFKF